MNTTIERWIDRYGGQLEVRHDKDGGGVAASLYTRAAGDLSACGTTARGALEALVEILEKAEGLAARPEQINRTPHR